MVISRFNDRRKKNFAPSNSNSKGPYIESQTPVEGRTSDDDNGDDSTVIKTQEPEEPKEPEDHDDQQTQGRNLVGDYTAHIRPKGLPPTQRLKQNRDSQARRPALARRGTAAH
ncbi:hypothetical protein CSIM01_00622 [Colletotrichum simmondsii]|uniref:Uncharacterized protein n=1 Tax=Colletotrichum simmondsii TaxID=703756 RepID=A0A135SJ10_9PEZI|nr:hypothetical protein CSIM01_00622 [Colletotrichum simmondsii]